MIQLIRRLLHAVVIWHPVPRSFIPEPPAVVVGGVYCLEQNSEKGNPWRREVLVKVKDVQAGWVLYAMAPFGTGLFQNESKSVKDFLAIYKAI